MFDRDSQTRALVLSPLQKKIISGTTPTVPASPELPPGIDQERRIERRDPAVRSALRAELGISGDQRLILQVGSGFKIKAWTEPFVPLRHF